MRRALSDSTTPAGFVRDSASLGVIFVSAVDDGSMQASLDDYARFLKARKADPSRVMVTGAFGGSDAGCTFGSATASAAPRLHAFFEQFPNRADWIPICQPDLSEAVSLFAQLVKTSLGAPCIPEPLADVEPDRPGQQLACAVWYQSPSDERVLAPCSPEASIPCWSVLEDPQICAYGDHQRMKIKSNGYPPDNTRVRREVSNPSKLCGNLLPTIDRDRQLRWQVRAGSRKVSI